VPVGVTIYDIAARARVSIATVSRVLNDHARVSEATRARVMAVAEELGYQPHVSAQSLARRKTHVVSAVIPMMTNYFFVEVLRGLQDRLAESEYDLLVYASNTLEDVDTQLDRALHRGRSAGVLLFSMPITEDRVQRLKRSRLPVILLDCMHAEFDSVSVDNEMGGFLATRHFIDQGRRRIGMVMASKGAPALERRRGYERALGEARLPLDESLIAMSIEVEEHGYTEQAGYDTMQGLLQRPERPDAVFATSDVQALGAMRALKERGFKVPGDVAVVGFDDIVISKYVGLSTLRQPMRQMGEVAVDHFLNRLQHPEGSVSHTVFSPSLIVRTTSGAPPNGHASLQPSS